jgi:hypothetical protein
MGEQNGFGWISLIVGLVIAGIGAVWLLLPSIPWLGHLPGDIEIKRENTRFYFPLATCLLLSLLLSLVLWLVRILRR